MLVQMQMKIMLEYYNYLIHHQLLMLNILLMYIMGYQQLIFHVMFLAGYGNTTSAVNAVNLRCPAETLTEKY
jgi:hypothetical protein